MLKVRVKKVRLNIDGQPVSCPHGRKVFLVDGFEVRNDLDSDFSQGGNGYAYPKFVPKDEIWVEDRLELEELPFVIGHECEEAEEMAKGASYDDAHDTVKKIEDAERRRYKEERHGTR